MITNRKHPPVRHLTDEQYGEALDSYIESLGGDEPVSKEAVRQARQKYLESKMRNKGGLIMDKNTAKAEREVRKLNARVEKLREKLEETTEPKKKKTLKSKLNDLLIQIGELHLDQEEYEKAMSIYNSLPWKSHGEQRYYGITRELIEREEYKKASELLEEALEKYPESSALLNLMGLLFYRMDDLYEALRYFDQALASDVNDITPLLYNKALSLNLLGYHEEAFKVLTELLEIVPDDPRYLIEMGYCNLERKEPWAAICYYRTAKEMGLESDNVYGGLCCSYMDADLRHEAYMIAKEGVEKIPDVVGLYENLAETAIDLGRLDEADEVIKKGLALEPENEPLKELQQAVKQRMAEKH